MLPTRICALLVLATLTLPSAYAGPFSAIYSFGDSLSDVGNDFALTGGTLPGAPYAPGRFSNGPIWLDVVSSALGLSSTPSVLGGTDYAYGGGETGVTPVHLITSQLDLLGSTGQIAQFNATHPVADPNALYTIWIGSNDLADLLLSGPTIAQIQATVAAMVANVDTAISTLAAEGAHNFLVVTVPDIGATPGARAGGPAAVAGASAASALFDSTLVNGGGPLPSLATIAAGGGLNLHVLDTYSLLDAVIANGLAFGFTNTTDACLTGSVNFAGGTPCAPTLAGQNQFLFWDSKHPTSATQAIVGQQALSILTPEPATWLATAVGLVVLLARRRRQ